MWKPADYSRFSRTRAMTGRARRLRREMTEAEKRLWWELRNSQLAGCSFRRQHPVGPCVLDFYCPALKLCIELDGDQHGKALARSRDARRTAWLRRRGIEVMRFWNGEVFEDMDGVLESILARIAYLDHCAAE